MYINNLISGLLLADIAINHHESSECKVPSNYKDLVDMATTTSSTGAATFMAFLVVLCLMSIMSQAEEYKSLSSRMEEDKSNRCTTFTAFLVVLCLMSIMSQAEEYKSLSSRMEEDKGNRPLLYQFLIPTVSPLVMPPVAVAFAFVEGGDFTGALHFDGVFMIPILYDLLSIIL